MRIFICILVLGTPVLAQTITPKIGDFPPLRVQAIVGTRERNFGNTGYHKMMDITPKLIVEGTSRLQPIPNAEATMVIVSMDTRAQYVEHKEVYKVVSAETLVLPAAANGDRREFKFAEPELKFDGDRDASNVGGEVYKFFVCGMHDPKTHALIYFYTSNMMLDGFCRSHPERRDEFLGMSKGAGFPSTFK